MIKLPAYAQVYNALKNEIVEGDIAVGEYLPPEADLEKRFMVSRTTVRKAVELLTREGYVSPKQGIGTVILDYRTKQTLNRVTSMSETLKNKGHEVWTKNLKIEIVEATPKLSRIFRVPEGEKIAFIERVQMADGKPISIIKNYIPYCIVPDIEKHTEEIPSLYMFLEKKYKLVFDSAHDRISAGNADKEEAELLSISEGDALLVMKRVCYINSKPASYDRLNIVGNKYELEVYMEGREY